MFFSLGEQNLKFNKKFKIKKTFLIILFLSIIVSILFALILIPSISNKFYHYTTLSSITNLLKISILSIIATIATQNKFRMILSMLPMFITAALIGEDRVNMIAFSLALGILMFEQRLGHPLVLLLLLYFFVKSFEFIFNIYKYGNGFYIQ